MKGFQRWMKEHPRKRTDGFFTFGGKDLSHEQVKKMVNYAVEKGYETEADIQTDEIMNLLGLNDKKSENVMMDSFPFDKDDN